MKPQIVRPAIFHLAALLLALISFAHAPLARAQDEAPPAPAAAVTPAPDDDREQRIQRSRRAMQNLLDERTIRQDRAEQRQQEIKPGSEPREGTLLPGQSVEVHGVRMTWQVQAGDQSTTPPGTILLESPAGHTEIKPESTQIYLNQVYLTIVLGVGDGDSWLLRYNAELFPAQWRPHAGPVMIYMLPISFLNPVQMGELRMHVREDAEQLPDGSSYLMLEVRNEADEVVSKLALSRGFQHNIGRYQIEVDLVNEATRTALLQVSARPDPTVKGRLAYLEAFVVDNDISLQNALENLAQHAGIEVRWLPASGHPQSAQYLNELRMQDQLGKVAPTAGPGGRPTGSSTIYTTTAEAIVDEFRKKWRVAEFTWIDDQTLEVTPRDYEHVVERRQAEEARQARNDKLTETFKNEYQPEMRAYPLQTITPASAQALIEPLLSRYILIAEGAMMELHIRQVGADAPVNARAEAKEFAVADDKAGALIVTAIPATHARIEELLGHVDSALMPRVQQTTIPERHRIEALLLTAAPPGAPPRTETEYHPLMPAVKYQGEKFLFKEATGGGSEVQVTYMNSEIGVPRASGPEPEWPPLTDWIDRPVSEVITYIENDLRIELAGLDEQTRTMKESPLERLNRGYDRVAERYRRESVLTVQDFLDMIASKTGFWIRRDPERSDSRGRYVYYSNVNHSPLPSPEEVQIPGVNPGDRMDVIMIEPRRNPYTNMITHIEVTYRRAKDSASHAGLSPEDLRSLGIGDVRELGRAVLDVTAERGELGRVTARLGEGYEVELAFQDLRDPYLILRGTLKQSGRDDEPAQRLLENSVYLETSKPALLGLTNLREALILVLRRLETAQ